MFANTIWYGESILPSTSPDVAETLQSVRAFSTLLSDGFQILKVISSPFVETLSVRFTNALPLNETTVVLPRSSLPTNAPTTQPSFAGEPKKSTSPKIVICTFGYTTGSPNGSVDATGFSTYVAVIVAFFDGILIVVVDAFTSATFSISPIHLSKTIPS